MTAAEVTLIVKARDEATKVLGKVDSATKGLGSTFAGVGKAALLGLGAAGLAVGAFAASAVSSASRLQESLSKVTVVFGEQADEIKAWADNSATAFGQSKQQALEAAGTFGNLFQAFGVGRSQAADMSTSLVELAADLASFNNTSVDEAIIALRSGLSGETEPLKRFGVALNDARLKNEALRMGLIATTTDALTPGARAQAAYALIMKDTALAQGDFARTSDGLANKQRILRAQFENVKATIGTALIPIFTALATVLADFLTRHEDDIERFANLLAEKIPTAVAAIASAIDAARPTVEFIVENMKVGLETLQPVLEWILSNGPATAAIITALGVAILLAFTPVTLPILAFVAALAAIIFTIGLVRQHWDEAWAAIQGTAENIIDAITGAITGFGSWIVDHWQQIVTGILAVVFPPGAGLFLLVTHWDTIRSAVMGIVTGLASSIAGAFTGVVGTVVGTAQSMASQVASAFSDLAFRMLGAGQDIVKGLWAGIESLGGWIVEQATAFAQGIYNAVKDGLGKLWPFSPSEAGVDVGEGLGLGIIEGLRRVKGVVVDAAKQFAADVQAAADYNSAVRAAFADDRETLSALGFTGSMAGKRLAERAGDGTTADTGAAAGAGSSGAISQAQQDFLALAAALEAAGMGALEFKARLELAEEQQAAVAEAERIVAEAERIVAENRERAALDLTKLSIVLGEAGISGEAFVAQQALLALGRNITEAGADMQAFGDIIVTNIQRMGDASVDFLRDLQASLERLQERAEALAEKTGQNAFFFDFRVPGGGATGVARDEAALRRVFENLVDMMEAAGHAAPTFEEFMRSVQSIDEMELERNRAAYERIGELAGSSADQAFDAMKRWQRAGLEAHRVLEVLENFRAGVAEIQAVQRPLQEEEERRAREHQRRVAAEGGGTSVRIYGPVTVNAQGSVDEALREIEYGMRSR